MSGPKHSTLNYNSNLSPYSLWRRRCRCVDDSHAMSFSIRASRVHVDRPSRINADCQPWVNADADCPPGVNADADCPSGVNADADCPSGVHADRASGVHAE